MPQIHGKNGHEICMNYSYGNSSSVPSCHFIEIALARILALFFLSPNLCPVTLCVTFSDTNGGILIFLGQTQACLNSLLLKRVSWPKACIQVAFGTRDCEKGDTFRRVSFSGVEVAFWA